MPLNIKNRRVEELVQQVADLAGETKTEAVRRALEERLERLSLRIVPSDRAKEFREFWEKEIWPTIPPELLGKPPMTREEEDEILGFGPDGV